MDEVRGDLVKRVEELAAKTKKPAAAPKAREPSTQEPQSQQSAGDAANESASEEERQDKGSQQAPGLMAATLSQKILETVPMSMDQLLAQAANPHIKLQRSLSDACVHRVNFHDLYRGLGVSEQAQLVSQAQRGAAGWLVALPLDQHLALYNEDMAWNLRRWLLSEQLSQEDTRILCSCLKGGHEQLQPNHAQTCNHTNGRMKRHDIFVMEVADMLRSTRALVKVEPRAAFTDHEYGKGSPDLLVSRFNGPGRLLVEVSITCQGNKANEKVSATTPHAAAEKAQTGKHEKYGDRVRATGDRFTTAICEEAGAMGPELLELIYSCNQVFQKNGKSTDQTLVWPADTFVKYWTQRLSVALRRGAFIMREKLRIRAAHQSSQH